METHFDTDEMAVAELHATTSKLVRTNNRECAEYITRAIPELRM